MVIVATRIYGFGSEKASCRRLAGVFERYLKKTYGIYDLDETQAKEILLRPALLILPGVGGRGDGGSPDCSFGAAGVVLFEAVAFAVRKVALVECAEAESAVAQLCTGEGSSAEI